MNIRRHVIGGVEEMGDAGAPYGSRLWCIAMLRTTVRDKHDATTKASDFQRDLVSLRDNNYWKELADADGVLFSSWEDFYQYREPYGLGLTMRQVEAVLAETDDRISAAAVLARARPLPPPASDAERRPKGGRGNKAGDDVTSFQRGNSATYLAARIKRDHPDIAARIEAGEFKSMRQAAVAAGIVNDDPVRRVMGWWRKATFEEQEEFLREVGAVRLMGRSA